MMENAKYTPGPWITRHEALLIESVAQELLEVLERIASANEFDVSRGRACAEEMRQIARNAIAKIKGGE